jgi:TIR domain
MRVFISHAWEDKPLALALAQLPDFIDAWVDVRELLGGEKLDPTIITAIEDSHVFIVLISRISLAKAWVAQEVNWAMAREAQKDRVFVLPVVWRPAHRPSSNLRSGCSSTPATAATAVSTRPAR